MKNSSGEEIFKLENVPPVTIEKGYQSILDFIEDHLISRDVSIPGGVRPWGTTRPPEVTIRWYAPNGAVALIDIQILEAEKVVLHNPRLFSKVNDLESRKTAFEGDAVHLFGVWCAISSLGVDASGQFPTESELEDLFKVYRASRIEGITQRQAARNIGVSVETIGRQFRKLKDFGIVDENEEWRTKTR